jgi:hypothetical protein
MRSKFVKGSSVLIWISCWLLTGCANQHSPTSSTGVKITQNSDYDESVVNRISQNWYAMLDSHKFIITKTGKVVVYFKLHSDGTVSDIKIMKNEENDLLAYACVRTIQETAPFQKWSPEMVKKIGDHCDVDFTFDYYERRRLW